MFRDCIGEVNVKVGDGGVVMRMVKLERELLLWEWFLRARELEDDTRCRRGGDPCIEEVEIGERGIGVWKTQVQ